MPSSDPSRAVEETVEAPPVRRPLLVGCRGVFGVAWILLSMFLVGAGVFLAGDARHFRSDSELLVAVAGFGTWACGVALIGLYVGALVKHRHAAAVAAALTPLGAGAVLLAGPKSDADFWGSVPTVGVAVLVTALVMVATTLAAFMMLPRRNVDDAHPTGKGQRQSSVTVATVIGAVGVVLTLLMVLWAKPFSLFGGPPGPDSVVDDGGVWSTLSVTDRVDSCSRRNATVTFTDAGVFVFGGNASSVSGCDAFKFSFEDRTWSRLNVGLALPGRDDHVAVWTGTEVVVWGGSDGSGDWYPGFAYSAEAEEWRLIGQQGQPTQDQTAGYVAVWTGSEMIVWGGPLSSGAYDPDLDRWRPIGVQGAPPIIGAAGAAWTGNELAIWGGRAIRGDPSPFPIAGTSVTDRGALFDPDSDNWVSLNGGQPRARESTCMAVAGDSLVLWGSGHDYMSDGGVYDLQADEWRLFSSGSALTERREYACGTTGELYFIVGGWGGAVGGRTEAFTDGALFDPVGNRWYRIPPFDELGKGGDFVRQVHAHWHGERIVVIVAHRDNRLGAYAYTPGESVSDND